MRYEQCSAETQRHSQRRVDCVSLPRPISPWRSKQVHARHLATLGRHLLVTLGSSLVAWLFAGCAAMTVSTPIACGTALSQPWTMSIAPPQRGSNAVLNVKDLGAIGDGRTDDTRAFANALNQLGAQNGGKLLIPPGTYMVGDLRVPDGTFIRGIGFPVPVLVKSPSATTILQIFHDAVAGVRTPTHDVSIEHLVLRGRSVEDGFSQFTHNVKVAGVERLAVRSVEFEAMQGDGLYLGSRNSASETEAHNSDVSVVGSTFDGVNAENRQGVSIIDCTRCLITGNTFVRLTRPDMPGAIDVEPNTRRQIINNIEITNNTVTGNGGGIAAITVALKFKDFVQQPNHILIQNNEIQNSGTGIAVLWLGGPPTRQTPALETLVLHNLVTNTDHALRLDGTSGVTIVRNVFSGNRLDMQVGQTLGTVDLHFRNNEFVAMGASSGHGITMFGPVSTVEFTENAFVDLGSPGSDASAILFAGGAVDNVRYIGDTFSTPNGITRLAISATDSVSFFDATNVWTGNRLSDGIQLGNFPHTLAATACR